ncbi:MAG: hypothetical protein VCD00_07510 [Candidatus Hydrogenedentota bacterium]
MQKGLICLTIACVAAGCAHLGGGVDIVVDGVQIPEISVILADLEANDKAIHSFQGAGRFFLESPNFSAKRKFRGSLRFQRPNQLHVEGRDRLANITVFRLICVNDEFLMEFPRRKEESFYQLEGEEFEDIPFSVSPSDIVREMFLPEEWGDVKKRSLEIIDYLEESSTLVVEMREGRRLHRRIQLNQVDNASPRWVITKHIRFDDAGRIIAMTEMTEFSRIEEALFPERVDAYFPTEDTRMIFTMTKIQLNKELDQSLFDIRARARELNLSARSSVSDD